MLDAHAGDSVTSSTPQQYKTAAAVLGWIGFGSRADSRSMTANELLIK